MRAQIQKHWDAIRSSYWFVPTLMALAAIALSLLSTALDQWLDSGWARGFTWLSFNTAAGARAVLSTIAGSMITVAGVTFSITIATVAYATAQLGPHLLGNFMRDPSNQITLGTFIATFLYCLLVLRTVHGGEGDAGSELFIPHLGIMLALILALASLGVLIFFIHHTPRSIQASEVIARVGEELNGKLATLFPGRIGAAPPESARPAEAAAAFPTDRSRAVRADASGYITHLDAEGLLELAKERDLVLRLVRQPGDFVSEGDLLAQIAHLEGDDDIESRVRLSIALGRERTQAQDLLFLVQQLVEISVRALSPGVNDPYIAISCLDWLGSGLSNLGRRSAPSGYRYDDDGRLRVIMASLTFEDVAAAIFDEIRPHASRDLCVTLHLLAVVGRILETTTHPPYRAALLEHAAALKVSAEAIHTQPRDLRHLTGAYERLPHTTISAASAQASLSGA